MFRLPRFGGLPPTRITPLNPIFVNFKPNLVPTVPIQPSFRFPFTYTPFRWGSSTRDVSSAHKTIFNPKTGAYEAPAIESYANKRTIALVGKPNVGKSTFFNKLVEREKQRALISSGISQESHRKYLERPETEPMAIVYG